MAGLLLFVVLAVLQLAIALYVRNTLIASASEEGPASARAQTPRPVTVQRAPRLSSRPPSVLLCVGRLRPYDNDVRWGQGRRCHSGCAATAHRTIGPGDGFSAVQGRAFSEEQVSAASGSSPSERTDQAARPGRPGAGRRRVRVPRHPPAPAPDLSRPDAGQSPERGVLCVARRTRGLRVFVTATDDEQVHGRAFAAATIAFEDFGFDREATLSVRCDGSPCLRPGGVVTSTAVIDVPLPLIPDFLAGGLPSSVSISSTAWPPSTRMWRDEKRPAPVEGARGRQIAVLILGLFLVVLVFILGAIDVTAAQLARMRLLDTADAVALDAADALDVAAVYEGGPGATRAHGPFRPGGGSGAAGAHAEADGDRQLEPQAPTGTTEGRTAEVTLTGRATLPMTGWILDSLGGGVTITVTSARAPFQ